MIKITFVQSSCAAMQGFCVVFMRKAFPLSASYTYKCLALQKRKQQKYPNIARRDSACRGPISTTTTSFQPLVPVSSSLTFISFFFFLLFIFINKLFFEIPMRDFLFLVIITELTLIEFYSTKLSSLARVSSRRSY